MDITLSNDQQKAADSFLEFLDTDETEMLLSGKSGSGKSTTVEYFIELVRNKNALFKTWNVSKEVNIIITATTNKAANVIAEMTNTPPKTIHSLLGLKVVNNSTTGKTYLQKTRNTRMLNDTLIFLDEVSMVDDALFKIIREQTNNCKIVYVGDSNQLTPVKKKISPVFIEIKRQAHLTEIQRQLAGNPIIELGEQFRETVETGIFKPTIPTGTVQAITQEEFSDMAPVLFDTPNHNNKVITWSNSKTELYNKAIRKLHTNSIYFEIGEKVVLNTAISCPNTNQVIPTDSIITITGVERGERLNVQGTIYHNIRFSLFVPDDIQIVKGMLKHYANNKQWADYFGVKDAFADLRAVHSSTVHKAQGSTYDNVILDLSDIGRCNKPEEVARMLYVAITRPKNNCYLYGELPAKYRGE